jgi:hypothetical protein
MSTLRLLDLLFGLMGCVGLGWDGNRDKKKKKTGMFMNSWGLRWHFFHAPFSLWINSRRHHHLNYNHDIVTNTHCQIKKSLCVHQNSTFVP